MASSRCVFGCKTIDTGIPVHKFPRKVKYPDLFRVWVKICGDRLKDLTDEQILKNKKICDVHFIDAYVNRASRLNNLAVPTVNLPPDSEKILPTVLPKKPAPPHDVQPAVENEGFQGTPSLDQVSRESSELVNTGDGVDSNLTKPAPSHDVQPAVENEVSHGKLSLDQVFRESGELVSTGDGVDSNPTISKVKVVSVKKSLSNLISSDDENYDEMDSVASPLTESGNIQSVTNTGRVMNVVDGKRIVKKKIKRIQLKDILKQTNTGRVMNVMDGKRIVKKKIQRIQLKDILKQTNTGRVMNVVDGKRIVKKKIKRIQLKDILKQLKSCSNIQTQNKINKIKHLDDGNYDVMDSVDSPLTESGNIQSVTNTGCVMDTVDDERIVKKKITKIQTSKYEDILKQIKSCDNIQMQNRIIKIQHLEPKPRESRSCAVCTTINQYSISLDGAEGKQNDLCGKVSAYLPIKVSQQDVVCFPCATSLISFHNLVTSCKKAHGILTDIKNEDDYKPVNENNSQLDPEQPSKKKTFFESVKETDTTFDTKNINNPIIKKSDVSHTLEMYNECLKADSITEEPCHTKITVCSYNWKEINNICNSNSQGPYTCHLCCECLPNVKELYEHFKDCSKRVCSRCLDVFSDVEMLKKHLILCYKYACYICPAKFRLMSALITHQEQNHSTSMCDLCHQTFLNDLECEEHKLHKHKFLCELCNSSFESTIEGVRYRHSIIPDDRLLCLSCYGVYNCTVKSNEATTYHVKDKSVVCNVSSQISDKGTSADELIMFTANSTMFDVTASTSEYESTAGKVEKLNCQTCGRVFNSQTELSDHECITESHLVHPNDHLYAKVENLLTCTYCQKIFASVNYLQLHILRNHPLANEVNLKLTFTCPVCASSFQSNKAELKKHKNYQCVLECGDCGKKCNGKIAMRKHAKLHSNQRYVCDTCGKAYLNHNSFQYHKRMNHMQEELVCCAACGVLVNKYKYAGHFSRHHKDQKLHQCHLCFKNFKSRTSLRLHSQSHNLLRPFTCTVCPSIFKAAKYLTRHVAKCHHPTHNVCRFCKKVFQSIEEFDQHFTEVHESFSKFILLANGEGYHCSHCDKIFDSSQSMFAHSKEINKEVRNSQQYNFKCAHCKRDFSTKYSLLNHIRSVHKLEHDFKCSYCPERFKHKDAKKAHESTHTGEKPFSCSVCDRKFRHKTDMKRHETKHKAEPAFHHGNTLGNWDLIGDGSKKHNEKSRVDSALFDWPMQEDY